MISSSSRVVAQEGFDLAPHLGRIQLEAAGDAQFLGAGAEQVGGAAFAEQQTEGAEQQRLARAGLAGPGAEARLQLDAHVLDQGQVLYRIIHATSPIILTAPAQPGERGA